MKTSSFIGKHFFQINFQKTNHFGNLPKLSLTKLSLVHKFSVLKEIEIDYVKLG